LAHRDATTVCHFWNRCARAYEKHPINAICAEAIVSGASTCSRSTSGILTEKHAKKPVIVMNCPKDIKAFYVRLDDDGRTVAAMDVLTPGIGEIIGGSQREERIDGIGPQHGRVPHRPGGLRPPFPPPRAAQL
jgi:aspartyl/asparaginyl-tRNA synthetase